MQNYKAMFKINTVVHDPYPLQILMSLRNILNHTDGNPTFEFGINNSH